MASAQTDIDPDFEALLTYLKEIGGQDLTGYKRSSLMRRVEKRMTSVGTATYGDYRDYLSVHPDERDQLLRAVLINVTEFFRDPSSWDYLATTIIPKLLAKRAEQPIRVWSAACATGEEAYSLVMAFTDVAGIDAVRDRLTVVATDIDSEALDRARNGSYLHRELAGVSAARIEQYFVPSSTPPRPSPQAERELPSPAQSGATSIPSNLAQAASHSTQSTITGMAQNTDTRLTFREDLRGIIDFRRHDLIHHDPIDSVDLLVCRNALMYFNSDVQAAIVSRFHDALASDGFLFLGRADMLLSYGHLFSPFELRRRVFVRTHASGAPQTVIAVPGPVPGPDRRVNREERQTIFRHDDTSPIDSRPLRHGTDTRHEVHSSGPDLVQNAAGNPRRLPTSASQSSEFHWLRDALAAARHDVEALNVELAAVLSACPSAIVIVDEHLQIVRWNPSAGLIWDMPATDAIGQSLRTLPLGESRKQIIEAAAAALSSCRAMEPVTVNLDTGSFRFTATPCGRDGQSATRVVLAFTESPG
ncbi:MAG: CheR family methyltransferase [Capsulimonadaceae bacterium]